MSNSIAFDCKTEIAKGIRLPAYAFGTRRLRTRKLTMNRRE
jgi:hypothetical protein